ncbi:ABC transporter ATP-binding protein [Paucibacter sp. APW11]|uniref:ABC transporter ATP-binding protein n=1 Tax=Roseateles aquae TaxID=3077235 RepID=A0ABU3P579_9BURK|nr:ABC transporter ATP-binding protein [Paucibacter sp. APW11]MDT8997731.1 ABC transporter ATP-binding protein [Paucibacter sp. APW11]
MHKASVPPIVIEAQQLTKVFMQKQQSVQALRGVDLQVRSGDFTVISGPSGSGKTTLLNILGLLDVPTSGRVSFEGHDLAGAKPADLAALRRDHIGFVFQAYNLMPVLTAVENTEMVMEFQGVPANERRRISAELLQALGLGELMDRFPDQLSGGQQQRVAVARAIASKPRLVIADEPTANLDSKTADSLMDLMSELNHKHGITFVFSSHDPHVIQRARRVLTLRDGIIVNDSAAPEAAHAA